MPTFEHNQKLPLSLTVFCVPELLNCFQRMMAIWNLVTDGAFNVVMGSIGNASTIGIGWGNFPSTSENGITYPYGDRAAIQFPKGATVSDVTMLHELGHALGLDHSDAPHSIMNPIPLGTKNEATLVQDDIDGVRLLYGLAPKVFDVAVKVSGRTAVATALYGKVLKQRFNRLAKGENVLDCAIQGISVYKTVEIP